MDDFKFSPDGKTIWFTAVRDGTGNLYTMPAAGGTPKLAVQGGAVGAFQPADGFALFAKSSLVAPPDLYRLAGDGTTRQLTNENAGWLSAVDLPKPASLTVAGAGGTPVQYWLLKPPHFDATKKYPVVFLIHGGPQGSWEDAWSTRWNPSLWAAQGWVVAAPNPRGSTGFGQKFVDEISQDWCGKAMTDLDAVFDAVSALPYVDRARAGIAGASYGGYAVDWLIGHTNRFKAAVTHDGVFNLESMALATEELWFPEWEFGGPAWSATARRNFARCSPHLSADKIRTPTFVITNEQDFRVPLDQGLQLFTALRRNGVPSEGLVFQNEGHWVLSALDSKRWHESVFGWLHRYLAPVSPLRSAKAASRPTTYERTLAECTTRDGPPGLLAHEGGGPPSSWPRASLARRAWRRPQATGTHRLRRRGRSRRPLPSTTARPTGQARNGAPRRPARSGWTRAAMATLSRDVRRHRWPTLRSLLVVHRGYVVLNEYIRGAHPDSLEQVQGVSATVTGLLVGVAARDGMVAPQDGIAQFFPEYADLRSLTRYGIRGRPSAGDAIRPELR